MFSILYKEVRDSEGKVIQRLPWKRFPEEEKVNVREELRKVLHERFKEYLQFDAERDKFKVVDPRTPLRKIVSGNYIKKPTYTFEDRKKIRSFSVIDYMGVLDFRTKVSLSSINSALDRSDEKGQALSIKKKDQSQFYEEIKKSKRHGKQDIKLIQLSDKITTKIGELVTKMDYETFLIRREFISLAKIPKEISRIPEGEWYEENIF